MKCRYAICCAAMLLSATTLAAQERPGQPAGEDVPAARGAAPQDTVVIDTARGPRLRLHASVLSDLPADDAYDVLALFPGFMQSMTGDLVYRGSGTQAVPYVDGVPLRSLIHAGAGLVPSLNALGSISLVTGGVAPSRRGSAVVDLSTGTGGPTWSSDVRAHSDALSPSDWKRHMTRFELQTAGPVPGVEGLRLFLAGQLSGQKYPSLPGDGPVFVAAGTDTTFMLARTLEDSVRVVVPEYVPVDYARLPLGNADRSNVTAALTFERGGGDYALRYHRMSTQTVTRELHQLYNPDAWNGRDDVAQIVSLSIHRPLAFGVEADAVISHQRFDIADGMLEPTWASANSQPTFGINTGSLGLLADPADWPVTDPVLLALRSGIMPIRQMTFTTTADPMVHLRQGVPGISQTLRLNPYGARAGFPVSGLGNSSDAALSWEAERRWYGRAELSRRLGALGFGVGGELDRSDVESFTLPLADGVPTAYRESPGQLAGFFRAEAAHQNLFVNAGVRVERHSTDVLLPRLPGFNTFVPDSLRRDAWVMRAGEEPWQQRMEQLVDCGGAATAAARTNAAGTVVCKDNFLPVPNHTVVSPRMGVEYRDIGRFDFRASYGSFVQPRVLLGASMDLMAVGISIPQPGPVEPVREDLAEFGVRARTYGDSWVDVRLFHLDVNNPVVVRSTQFVNPVTHAPINILLRTNGEAEVTSGVELTMLQQITSWSGFLAAFGYSSRESYGSSRTDPMRASGMGWFDLGRIATSGMLGSALDDLSVHAIGSWSQGWRYTRLRNVGAGTLVGRLWTGPGSGTAAEDIDASMTPSRKQFDLRVTKGFRVAGVNARAVADLRNPLGFEHVHSVYAETGTTENSVYRDRLSFQTVAAYSGLGTVRDMVIDEWVAENELNRFMLHRAEQRYGNGDGIFTVEEMTAAVDAYLDLMSGPQWLREDRRELRLGVEIRF